MAKLFWTQKQDIGPRARFAHAMAFDIARKRVMLFGGSTLGDLLGDTWEWDGEDWTQVQDMGPSPRSNHALAYDSGRNRLVLFGGIIGGSTTSGDTWEWDGEDWTQMADTGPRMRAGHAMTYDAARRRVVLFGGNPITGALADTWSWDGTDWVQVEEIGPSARYTHTMTYDSVRKRIVLFGGTDSRLDGLADTWEWDGTLWRQTADFGPPGASLAAMVFRSDRASLFGGISALDAIPGRRLFGDTWEWDGARWTARQDIGASARYGHALAFDSVRKRVVMFGGQQKPMNDPQLASGLAGDTWEYPDVPGTL